MGHSDGWAYVWADHRIFPGERTRGPDQGGRP